MAKKSKKRSTTSGSTPQNRKQRVPADERRRLAAQRKARSARLQWLAIVGVGVAIIGGVLLVAALGARSESGDTSRSAWDLPVVRNDTNGDDRLTLSEFRGKPIVVNFYADWCTACEDELPGFSAVANEFRDVVHFVHVNSQETGSRTRLPEEFGTDWWPIARDINGQRGGGSGLFESLTAGRRSGMPITAFYDANGSVADVNIGAMSESELRAVLASRFGVGV